MCNRKKHITCLLMVLTLFGITYAIGQSTNDKAGVSNNAGAQTPADHLRIEKELMLQAKQNINKNRKGNVTLLVTDGDGQPAKNVSIEINQVSQHFLFGNLSEEVLSPRVNRQDSATFTNRFKALFNFTELTVKWVNYESVQGKPEWQKFQQKLDWCKANNITPKGHTLGWTHEAGTPKWLYKYSAETATQLYKSRVQNVVAAFKNQVTMWDVVNEPVTTIPWERALMDTSYGAGLIDAGNRYNTKGITLQETLPWVEQSFKWAHEADANGDFMLNEFYVIAKPEIREKFYQLIKELQKRNTPITGIGIQGHEPRDQWFSPIEVLKTFDRYKELGLPLHITEFTPQSSGIPITGGWRQGTWTEEAQAEFSEQFYTLAFSHPAMVSIHWWGLSDRMIWLKNGGLLDKDLNPKPVYNRLYKLIKEEWMTKNVNKVTDKNGKLLFRGFAGNYEVVITDSKGNKTTAKLNLQEQKDNEWKLTTTSAN